MYSGMTSGSTSSPAFPRTPALVVILVALLAVALPRLMVVGGLPTTDEGFQAYYAQIMHASLAGGHGLPDTGPLMFYSLLVNWVFAFGANPMIALRLVDMLVAVTAGYALYRVIEVESRSRLGALLIALLFLFTMNHPTFTQHGFKNSIHAAYLPLFAALWLGLTAPTNATARRWLGVGALLHDIGLADIPDRIARPRHELTAPERHLRELHCDYGVRIGRQIGLPDPVLRIIAQHHELADGSGYPKGLKGEQIDPAARIVSLVNYYDNLCNPADLAKAMTPHEALSLMFAQRRAKFDARALQVMIRCLGVYPPGSVVRLSNDALALVSSVNPQRPLRPWVTVFDPQVPRDEAIMLDLDEEPDINITKALRPIHLPPEVYEYLSPRKRVTYYFDADARQGRTA